VTVPGSGLDRPVDDAGLPIQRDQPAVQRAHEDFVAEHRYAAIHITAADARPALRLFRDTGVPMPESLPGTRVQREDVAVWTRSVHHAVHDDRRGLGTRTGLRQIPA